jgi:hypothetical protein
VLVADQGMVKSTWRSLGGTDNKDDEFDALVMCELCRRHYLEIYDRRLWVKELSAKIQKIRRALQDLKTNKLYKYPQGTASLRVSGTHYS